MALYFEYRINKNTLLQTVSIVADLYIVFESVFETCGRMFETQIQNTNV